MAIPKQDLGALVAELRRSRLLVTPQELGHRRPEAFPTGLEALDRLLGGGLPQGRIVACAGAGTGATALALSIAAEGTRVGRLVAWVDRADGFDPLAAADAGVELGRLLWCRPRSDRDALRAADVLLGSGAFPLVVLDARAPEARRVGQGAWLRLARTAESRRGSLLVLGDVGAQAFAAATLRATPRRARFEGQGPGRTFEGLEVRYALEGNRLGLPPRQASLAFRAPSLTPPVSLDSAPGAVRLREGR